MLGDFLLMIEIKNVNKSYQMGTNQLHVLKGIDFKVSEGELVSIMGSSGSGKSTLLNILGMLDEADSGSYTLDGVLIRQLNEKIAAQYRNQFLGFIFQSFNLINFKSALDNVALPLYYKGVPRKERLENLNVIYSPIDQSADAYIIEKLKGSKSDLCAVSNDREIIVAAKQYKHQTLSCQAFLAFIFKKESY